MAYVMIADDDEHFASVIARTLRSAGHEVRTELDIAGAVASMKARPPDLLILDVMFPEDHSAGFKLARSMRQFKDKLKDIPVLMLTAINAMAPLGFSARDIDDRWLPVSDFVEKPVDLDVLCDKVSKLLGTGSAR